MKVGDGGTVACHFHLYVLSLLATSLRGQQEETAGGDSQADAARTIGERRERGGPEDRRTFSA